MTFKVESSPGALFQPLQPSSHRLPNNPDSYDERSITDTLFAYTQHSETQCLSTKATYSYIRNYRKKRGNFCVFHVWIPSISTRRVDKFFDIDTTGRQSSNSFFLRETRENAKCSFRRRIRLDYSVLRLMSMGIFVATVRFCNWFYAVPCYLYSGVIYPPILRRLFVFKRPHKYDVSSPRQKSNAINSAKPWTNSRSILVNKANFAHNLFLVYL
jgi:hypothetical protein